MSSSSPGPVAGKPATLPIDKREVREALLEALRNAQHPDSEPDNSRVTADLQAETEKLHLEIILKFVSLRCRDPRRCAKIRCRRSGVCTDRAETLRTMGPQREPQGPIPPRRARFRQENLLERDRSA